MQVREVIQTSLNLTELQMSSLSYEWITTDDITFTPTWHTKRAAQETKRAKAYLMSDINKQLHSIDPPVQEGSNSNDIAILSTGYLRASQVVKLSDFFIGPLLVSHDIVVCGNPTIFKHYDYPQYHMVCNWAASQLFYEGEKKVCSFGLITRRSKSRTKERYRTPIRHNADTAHGMSGSVVIGRHGKIMGFHVGGALSATDMKQKQATYSQYPQILTALFSNYFFPIDHPVLQQILQKLSMISQQQHKLFTTYVRSDNDIRGQQGTAEQHYNKMKLLLKREL